MPQVSHSLVVPQFVMWEHSGELVGVIIITLFIIVIFIIDIVFIIVLSSSYKIFEKNSKIVHILRLLLNLGNKILSRSPDDRYMSRYLAALPCNWNHSAITRYRLFQCRIYGRFSPVRKIFEFDPIVRYRPLKKSI